jgi:uncharacterized membrane protein YfhO
MTNLEAFFYLIKKREWLFCSSSSLSLDFFFVTNFGFGFVTVIVLVTFLLSIGVCELCKNFLPPPCF